MSLHVVKLQGGEFKNIVLHLQPEEITAPQPCSVLCVACQWFFGNCGVPERLDHFWVLCERTLPTLNTFPPANIPHCFSFLFCFLFNPLVPKPLEWDYSGLAKYLKSETQGWALPYIFL